MIRTRFAIACALMLLQTALAVPRPEAITRIAFGSCAKPGRPQPIWETIISAEPDLFLFVGDNVYADTEDMAVMRKVYEKQAAVPGFQSLRRTVFVDGVWDDHDYGQNDAGREYPKKKEAQKEYARFFQLPEDSIRRSREGIYDAWFSGAEGQRVQVILLDTRYFRSKLKQAFGTIRKSGNYVATRGDDVTLLGEAQWEWLEEQLKNPADLRVIVSSIQVVPEEHGWERWSTFPDERDRLYRLIEDTRANGVIFVSGDRHHYELSRDTRGPYPLYDLTSSGLNEHRADNKKEPNRHRVGRLGRGPNFGLLEIDWSAREVELRVVDDRNATQISHRVKLEELRVKP